VLFITSKKVDPLDRKNTVVKLLYIKAYLTGQKKLGIEQEKCRIFFTHFFLKGCNRVGMKTQKEKNLIDLCFCIYQAIGEKFSSKCPKIVTKLMLNGYMPKGIS